MCERVGEQRMLALLADLLDYPALDLGKRVGECAAMALEWDPEAADLLSRFQAYVRATPQGRLEEVYTTTFDLDATWHPYVGYHLFGETYKRSVFLLELKERYRAQGFDPQAQDLPDRLSVLLRFLAVSTDQELNRELVVEALLPALDKMMGAAQEGDDAAEQPPAPEVEKPYRDLLLALKLLLEQLQQALPGDVAIGFAGGEGHG